jgi:hypothetical protein
MEKTEHKIYVCSYCKHEAHYEKRRPLACPSCGQKGEYGKPKTEHVLSELQAKYLETDEAKYLEQMIKVMVPYTRSILLKGIQRKEYSINPNNLEDIAFNSTLKLFDPLTFKKMSRKNPNERWHVTSSFAGAVEYKIKEVIFDDNNITRHVSLNEIVEETGKELMELAGGEGMEDAWRTTAISEDEKKGAVNSTMAVLIQARDMILQNKSPVATKTYIHVLLAILVMFRKGITAKDQCISTFEFQDQKILEAILLEMRNRLEQTRRDKEYL